MSHTADTDRPVQHIAAADVLELRDRILGPHHPGVERDMRFPGDDSAATLHAGVRDDAGELVAVGTIMLDAAPAAADIPSAPATATWRIRGMATEAAWRGAGLGAAVLQELVAHAIGRGGELLWCNARTPAIPFYERYGMRVVGDEFEIPHAGPHRVMWRGLKD